MRVLQVVTLCSEDGAFGGPTSLARAQCRALGGIGHRAEIATLWRGRGDPPARFGEVSVRTLPARTLVPGQGFSGLFNIRLPGLLWRRSGAADVVHVHAGRDLVSLAAMWCAIWRGRRLVVQTHGMIRPRHGAVARAFDAVLRPAVGRASAVLALTDQEERDLGEVFGTGGPPVVRVRNGVERRPGPVRPARRPDHPLVLFLSRLQARKRPVVFVRAAAVVHERFPAARFELCGADGGELGAVRAEIERLGLEGVVGYGGALTADAAAERMGEAWVHVLPSVNEVFPMSVLEALASGTPTVCTESSGIADRLRDRGAAVVTDTTTAGLADGILALLEDEERWQDVRREGWAMVADEYSAERVARDLEGLYAPGGPADDAVRRTEREHRV